MPKILRNAFNLTAVEEKVKCFEFIGKSDFLVVLIWMHIEHTGLWELLGSAPTPSGPSIEFHFREAHGAHVEFYKNLGNFYALGVGCPFPTPSLGLAPRRVTKIF